MEASLPLPISPKGPAVAVCCPERIHPKGPTMEFPSTYDLKRWVKEHAADFDPPARTNRVLVSREDFIVIVLRGPNERLDFHVDPADEFFLQIEGEMELHVKPANERRRVVKIREGETFLCPGGVPHSPRRGPDTWGLVIECKRRPEETEEFVWFCERCDCTVYSRSVNQGGLGQQVAAIYEAFNADESLRTCTDCGYVFSPAVMAERLGFLEP